MGTKITIEFEANLKKGMLQSLLNELEATCSEDENGYSWAEGKDSTKWKIDVETYEDGAKKVWTS